MKKLKINKQKLKERVATLMATVMIVGSSIPAFMYMTATPVQAAGVVEGNNVSVKGKASDGVMEFFYGTKFASATELRDNLVAGVSDTEDGNSNNTKVELTGLKAGSNVENVVFSSLNGAWNKVLSVGTYIASFKVKDNGGKWGYADITFRIVPLSDPTKAVYCTPIHKYYLQGTPITDELLARGIEFLDKITYKKLTYTSGKVTQGTYTVSDWGGLDSNKIMNNGKGYDYEYYMKNKAKCDAENTYTITYQYKGNGQNKVYTATSKVTIIPVFPTFSANEAGLQIYEGYEATFDNKGNVTSYANRIGIDYLKKTDTLNLKAFSIINGDVDGGQQEDCSDSLYIYSTTYANGVTEYNKGYITTSNGVYGDDLKGTKNDDGTFTLEDGTIYPYRGDIDFVVGAVNKYKNSRLSDYESDFAHNVNVHNPDPEDPNIDIDQYVPVEDLDDEDFDFTVKPQDEPIINGKDRYMYVGEDVTKDEILKKLDAKNADKNGNLVDITDGIVIETIEKIDAWGNSMGIIYVNDTDIFADGKLEEGLEYLKTDEECDYSIKFVVKNYLGRISSFDVIMHVVDTEVKQPYIRYTRLEYAIKTPENLDENNYNIYYDKDSIWMNDKYAYTKLMYTLCSGMLFTEGVTGDEYVIMRWDFTHEQVLVTQSWHNDTGVALAGQPVPQGTVVNGCLFEDDNGKFIKYRDEDTHEMIKVYIDPDTWDYGMYPSEELNQKFYDTWYDDCCVVDLQYVSCQGGKSYAIIMDENGYYLYEDQTTGKRMVFNNAMNDLKITQEELVQYEKDGYIWEDTRDYSKENIYEYGLRVMIERFQNEINTNDELTLINKVMDTIYEFDKYNDHTSSKQNNEN